MNIIYLNIEDMYKYYFLKLKEPNRINNYHYHKSNKFNYIFRMFYLIHSIRLDIKIYINFNIVYFRKIGKNFFKKYKFYMKYHIKYN